MNTESNKIKEILEKYIDRMVNTRRNNKTIYLNKLTKKYFDLYEIIRSGKLDYVNIINNLINKRKFLLMRIKPYLTPEENIEKIEFEETYNKLMKIYQEARLIKKTSGIHALYIGFPYLVGKIKDFKIKAPLFLFPVNLIIDRKNREIILAPEENKEIKINKALIFVLKKYKNDIDIAEDKLLNIILDKNKDISEKLDEIKKELSKYINIQKVNYNIEKFLEDEELEEKFEIRNYLILGIFILFSTAIVEDYEKLLKLDDLGLIEYIFSHKENETLIDINIDKISEKEKYFIFDIDPSQERSILSFIKSNNKGILIHGPPGTGKSQTIVNLISQFIKDKKRVLMVCQKRTALEVVKNRLDAAGIKNVVLLEDYEKDRDYILKLMKSIIENHVDEDYDNKTLDEINEKIDKGLKELNGIYEVLSRKYKCGLSLYELYSLSKKEYVIRDEIDELYEIFEEIDIKTLIETLDEFEGIKNYVIYDYDIINIRKNWKDLSYRDRDKIIDALEYILKVYDIVKKNNKSYYAYEYLDKIKKLILILKKYKPRINYNDIEKIRNIRDFLREHKLNKKLNLLELENISYKLKKYDEYLSKNILFRLMDKFLNKEITKIEEYIKNLVNKYEADFQTIYGMYKSLIELRKYFEIPDVVDNNFLNKLLDYLNKEIEIWELYISLKNKFDLPQPSYEYNKILKKLKYLSNLGNIYRKYLLSLKLLQKYFTSKIKLLSKKELNKILKYVTNEFHNIKDYDLIKDELKNENWKLILLKYLNRYTREEIIQTYYYYWINKIEKDPEVLKFLRKINDYENLRERLLQLYNKKYFEVRRYISYLLSKPEVSNEARLKIIHEANKKRKKRSLREIMDELLDDILNIIPIWLATPEAVSAVFPLKKEIFDVVIIDEASQMPIEYIIPSLYRAKRFVVAGDENQLPPTDFFKSTFDEEDIEELEIKSLLDLCKGKCPTIMLTYHYRSKYEELINFSNYAFYEGKIITPPNKEKGKPFEFIKVNGVWRNRKNYEEAKKVVEKIYEILKENPNKSIGVVTFNVEQRDLIYELLDKKALEDEKFRELYERALNLKINGEDMGLFVRNIESVQGDERDIIIFSIGYARDKNGILRYYFGPLNRVGGENRLNVAITRAKEKVIIITSIDPEELNVEHIKNVGPKLLKKYLQYARAIANNDYKTAKLILNSLNNVKKIKESQLETSFEKDIYNELIKRGYVVDIHVGYSKYKVNFAIKDLEKDMYVLGILCDDKMYYNSKSAKERDLFWQKLLENKGWKIVRIWSRNWWLNKEKEIERIIQN